MLIQVNRTIKAPNFTIGEFWIDGKLHYFTCEDTVRDKKIAGITAIPSGKYKVVITFSNRFQKHLPLLLSVPNFTGIRIHSGNTEKDTEGCILIGLSHTKNSVTGSRVAMADFMPRLEAGLLGSDVWLSIS